MRQAGVCVVWVMLVGIASARAEPAGSAAPPEGSAAEGSAANGSGAEGSAAEGSAADKPIET